LKEQTNIATCISSAVPFYKSGIFGE